MSYVTTYNSTTKEYGKEWVEDEPILDEPVIDPTPTPEERLDQLEQNKADKSAMDELNEALNMILSGVTE